MNTVNNISNDMTDVELETLYNEMVDEYLEEYTDNMINNFEETPMNKYVASCGYTDSVDDAFEKAKGLLENELSNNYKGLSDNTKRNIMDNFTDLACADGHLRTELGNNYCLPSDPVYYCSFGEEEINLDEVNEEFLKRYPGEHAFIKSLGYYPLNSYNIALVFDVDAYIEDHLNDAPVVPTDFKLSCIVCKKGGNGKLSKAAKLKAKIERATNNTSLKRVI